MSKLKELVKDKYAMFLFYRSGQLWYKIEHDGDEKEEPNFIFPIPIEDTGNGTFGPIVKAITLMRWIRKELKNRENDS